MSKQPPKKPDDPKKPNGKPNGKPNYKLPPGFEFPMYPGFPSFEEMLKMKPLPGMEEEFAMALKTIESVCNTDFSKPIDLENVCGHGGPGVEMKEGYCLACYEAEGIGQLVDLLDLAEKFGPESAVQMMNPPSTSAQSSSGPSTSGCPGCSSSSAGCSSSSSAKKTEKPVKTEKKTDKTDKNEPSTSKN